MKGTLFTVQKALPLIPAGGAIVINGSMVSIKGIPGFGVYAATKGALRSFARTWSVDLKGRNIRVNIVSPGAVVTPAIRQGAIAGYDSIMRIPLRGVSTKFAAAFRPHERLAGHRGRSPG